MRIVDVHSHWGTQRGYPLRTEAELAKQQYTWRSDATYATEEEMVAEFRRNDVRAILDLGFTKDLPIDEAREYNDYAIAVQKQYPDAIVGNWITLDPKTGAVGVAEFRRCLDATDGFVGLSVPAASLGFPCCDPVFDPFYKLCIEYRRPIMVTVGYTGRGAGLPGGSGIVLELCHPRYVDQLAARMPELTIIAGRPAWPRQDEMIAVLLHKPNVWNELHGWRPKHYTASLKYEIPRRLKHKIMFGADYPLLRYERLVADWHELGYDESVLAKVFHENAEALFGLAPR
jgi:predicted TIM-barrel fold metal-dependent hydrolase